MKALVLKRYGGLDQIAFADIPRPALKPDEILVQVHAAGLNPIDYTIPKGTFKPILRFQLAASSGASNNCARRGIAWFCHKHLEIH
jgi:NADPH:quinone reductase-like Zn-dependent oxidoreductase